MVEYSAANTEDGDVAVTAGGVAARAQLRDGAQCVAYARAKFARRAIACFELEFTVDQEDGIGIVVAFFVKESSISALGYGVSISQPVSVTTMLVLKHIPNESRNRVGTQWKVIPGSSTVSSSLRRARKWPSDQLGGKPIPIPIPGAMEKILGKIRLIGDLSAGCIDIP